MKQEIVTQIDQQEEPKLKELKIQAAAEKKNIRSVLMLK
jgi:hypothetical protein